MTQSYDYSHRTGVEAISWERFAGLAAKLAEALAARHVEVIVGIARAGLFPATAVACSLRCELYPVRVTRRENDEVVFDHPMWKVDVAPDVAGKRVAVVDEMADTGETLALVAERVRVRGAAQVVTASLAAHTWAQPQPDVVALPSDALVLFPWDRRVFVAGRWQPHPEVTQALAAQGLAEETMTERILTLHPDGKQGVNIDRHKYEIVKQAILASIEQRGELAFGELAGAVEVNLREPLAGSVGWYTTTVKLDLEARGVIERVPGRSPQVLRIRGKVS